MSNSTQIAFAALNANRISAKRRLSESDSNSSSNVQPLTYIIPRLLILVLFLLAVFSILLFSNTAEQNRKTDEWTGFQTIIQVEDSNLNTQILFEYEYATN